MGKPVSLYLSPQTKGKIEARAWRSLSHAVGQMVDRYDYLMGLAPKLSFAPDVVLKLNYYVKEELPDHPLLLAQFASMVEPGLRVYVKDLSPLGVVALLDALEKRLALEREVVDGDG